MINLGPKGYKLVSQIEIAYLGRLGGFSLPSSHLRTIGATIMAAHNKTDLWKHSNLAHARDASPPL